MKHRKLKELLEYLLIKKNNFKILKEEEEFLNELLDLLDLLNNCSKNELDVECVCELNVFTIEKEIELNKCLDCELPLNLLYSVT
jgi:hypothetical protein